MTGKVLIAGASGLVGTAAAIEFAQAGWQVVALSRRVPELLDGLPIQHLALDLTDAEACRAAASHLSDVTHVVYTAVYELPGLMAGWADPHQIETNGRMLRNLLEPLSASARLQHVSLLQGTKAYGAPYREMRVPARESQPRVDHPTFYWVQEDYLKDLAERSGFGMTVFRPQLIVGPNHGVVMNLPPVIGIYAAIRKELGLPFSFPGGTQWVWEAADVRLVGAALLWASNEPRAHGETYNLTNGEVFSFRDMWPTLAATLGVETGPDESISLAEYLPRHAAVWQQVVEKHDLRPIPLAELLGESHHYADMSFLYGVTESAPAIFSSSVKVRQHGFTMVWNTEESFCFWLRDLMARRILPLGDIAPDMRLENFHDPRARLLASAR
ncbi:MAG: SDR family oxidoreductase [Gammaproteobacteria bacterium]|nr:SDR family oxidoreductase [Gammaproteobacteria bacterium]